MDLFSQVSGALTLQPNGSAGKTSFIANGTNLDKKSLNTIGPKQKATATSPKPTLANGADQLTLFQEGFPVSHTAQQENDWAKKMNAIYGRICCEQYAKLPQVSLWAKMFAASLIGTGDWYSQRCKLTWKLSGIKSRPFLYLQRASMPHTEGIESGLLQTPSTMEISEDPAKFKARAKKKGYRNGTTYNSLSSQLLYDPKWIAGRSRP